MLIQARCTHAITTIGAADAGAFFPLVETWYIPKVNSKKYAPALVNGLTMYLCRQRSIGTSNFGVYLIVPDSHCSEQYAGRYTR